MPRARCFCGEDIRNPIEDTFVTLFREHIAATHPDQLIPEDELWRLARQRVAGCECGVELVGATREELYDLVREHFQSVHPEMRRPTDEEIHKAIGKANAYGASASFVLYPEERRP